jgi:hypothetical protein
MTKGGRQQQMGVAFPDDLRAKLDAAAAESGNSIAEEIRQRVERSFAQDAAKKAQDEKTQELADDVTWLADAITYQVKPEGDSLWAWHSNVATHAALAEALRSWMEIIKPLPVGLLDPGDPPTLGLLGPGDPPTLGRATARQLQRIKAALQLSGGVSAFGLPSPELQRIQAALQLSGGVLPPGLLSPERNKEKKS